MSDAMFPFDDSTVRCSDETREKEAKPTLPGRSPVSNWTDVLRHIAVLGGTTRMNSNHRFWKIAAITQAVVLLALIGVVVWFYPVFRGVRYHFLDRSCSFGDDIGVAIMLRLGADPDGQQDVRQWQDIVGLEPTIPLFHATWNGDTNILRLLLDGHANPNPPPLPPDDLTLLGLAAIRGHADAARLLRDAGARLDMPGGGSVIDLARQRGHSNVVLVLQQQR
jgi:hypothetical protein